MNISSRCRFARAYEMIEYRNNPVCASLNGMNSIGFTGSIGHSRLRFAQRDAFDWVHWQYWTIPFALRSTGCIRLGSLAVLDNPDVVSLIGMNSIGFIGSIGHSRLRFAQRDEFD